MDILNIIKEEINNLAKLSQDDMSKKGGTYALSHAYERYIPIDKIEGLDPEPADWSDDNGIHNYEPNDNELEPIEVKYDKSNDVYYLQNGNHRIKQAKINNNKYVLAFIEPDQGSIGTLAKNRI